MLLFPLRKSNPFYSLLFYLIWIHHLARSQGIGSLFFLNKRRAWIFYSLSLFIFLWHQQSGWYKVRASRSHKLPNIARLTEWFPSYGCILGTTWQTEKIFSCSHSILEYFIVTVKITDFQDSILKYILLSWEQANVELC